MFSIVKSRLSLALLAGLIGMNAAIATAQNAPKKPSVWQQMKDAAKQAQQKNTAKQVPQQGRPSEANPKMESDPQGVALQDPGAPDMYTGSAKVAVSADKYDVLGIRLGMPAKDAIAALRSHDPAVHLAPETVKYNVLTEPLTYGLYGVNQVVLRSGNHALPNAEKIYLTLTMPPNKQLVSKISRFRMFSKETAPTQQSLVAELEKKYGSPSYDSGPGNLSSRGNRELFWVDDAQGSRLNNQVNSGGGYSNLINQCKDHTSFIPHQTVSSGDDDVQADPIRIKTRIEQGYEHAALPECANLTIIFARLVYGYPIGVSSPDVVGGMAITIGSAPLDHIATDATHIFMLQASKSFADREKQAAQKNKPDL